MSTISIFSRRALALGVLAAVLATAGCFDVHDVDPGVLLIDNFDQGAFPADSIFQNWMCFSFNPMTNQNYSCKLDSDTLDGSAHSLRLDFQVSDPPDGIRQYGGVALTSYATPGLYQDVTGFSGLGFDVELESGSPQLPSNTLLQAQFGCSTVQLTDGSEPGDYYLLQTTDSGAEWRRVVLSLADFSGPIADGRQVQGGVAACLRHVDWISFVVDENLLDGGSGAGTLKIDNVYLR